MSLLSKRGLLVGAATFIVSLVAVFSIWGLPNIVTRSSTVKGKVVSYLLDDRGAVTGLLLASGDQLRFNQQTGEIVATQIRIGDEVTATGHAGTRTSYGREVRAQQITANGRSIIEARPDPPRPPHDAHDRRGRHEPRAATSAPPEPQSSESVTQSDAGTANAQTESDNIPAETLSATGTIRTHLVNGRGDVDGIILSGGEQIRFSPQVGQLVIVAEQNAQQALEVSVVGTGARNERGTIIGPAQLTIGNQTISLGR